MPWRILIVALVLGMTPMTGRAQDKLVQLYAPPALVETGLLRHILPRFSLKTQVKVALQEDAEGADMVLGDEGRALFHGAGRTWHMAVGRPDHSGTKRLAEWLTSQVGQRTIIGFAPEGTPLFAPPKVAAPQVARVELAGDPALGQTVSRRECGRCHVVDAASRGGIGSTPSFAVLRSLPDWEARFLGFYVLNPHPAFTLIDGVTPDFPIDRPSPIVPVTLTLDEVEAVLAFVATMAAADLGAPLQHQ
ncbi:hypothetical protein [Primorskyibacter flagellatus]|uniref:Cytochrome c domain-containing protein n=1 Tax=Primorskyibacter flagellatus TaxID=1387277 RepID=A0A1W2ALM3_9RHOB|nr:hypothetical protein [Primorskyibacter flagellatus]SMC61412.1 hypothetical protein SAMN06295998_10395 [Primorskyibacter flagellatus]